MNELYPIEMNEKSIDILIRYLQLFDSSNNTSFFTFEQTKLYDIISANFSSIEKNKLLQLPTTIIYSIISNKHLKVESEDSLFEFIKKLFVRKEAKEEEGKYLDIISFYEIIHIKKLSENKLREFLDDIEITEMTTSLWENLKEMICLQNKNETKQAKHIEVRFENDRFNGIITRLGNGKAKQAFDNGTINITAASFHSDFSHPSKSLEYENNNYYYHSLDTDNRCHEGHTEWLCVDFKKRKIKPSQYSIKSYGFGHNLQNWILEGSNDEQSWDVLDIRNNEKGLDGSNSSNTFEIQKSDENDKFYRYLRIRQTGVNTNNNYKLIIRKLEYFGIIEEPK